MTWRYGLVKHKTEDWYQVHELYSDESGDYNSWTENGSVPSGESREEVIAELERMLADVKSESTHITDTDDEPEGKETSS